MSDKIEKGMADISGEVLITKAAIKRAALKSKTVNCLDCDSHLVIRDRDPDDWFCDDDVAVVCKLCKNPSRNLCARRASDANEFRAVTSACRPYRMREESAAPEWCPLRTASSVNQ